MAISNVRKEFINFLGVAQQMDGCLGSVLIDRFHQKRSALAAISEQPEPEIKALARASNSSPGAEGEREIQENYGIGGLKPDLDRIIMPKVAIQNPVILLDKLSLDRSPLLSGCRTKTRLPEELVQLDYRQPPDFAKLRGKSRFARGARTEDYYTLHITSLVLEGAEKGRPPRPGADTSRFQLVWVFTVGVLGLPSKFYRDRRCGIVR